MFLVSATDYKTDDIGEDPRSFVKYYSPQVRAYAEFWQEMTGEKVVKAGLFFVKTRQFLPVSLMGQPVVT